VEAVHVAAKTRRTYLAGQYRRMALGHTTLTPKPPYRDLGTADFDTREQWRIERRLGRRWEKLGYRASLQPSGL
jgi:hypothetical protein